MRVFIILVAFVVTVSAAPFTIPFHHGHDKLRAVRIPASDEAQAIAFTDFMLFASSEDGCARDISHGESSDIPDDASQDIEGVITFDNIKVNGQVCGTGDENDFMMLYSQDVLDVTLEGGKVLNLSFEAARSITIGGADQAVRRCGSWVEEYEQSYAFSQDIRRLLPSLSENGFIDNSTISERTLEEVGTWMVAAPVDRKGRVCLYGQVPEVVPTTTPDPEESGAGEDSSGSVGESSESGSESSTDSDTSTQEEDEEEQGAGIFGDANEEALILEQQEGNQSRSCFPSSAHVRLKAGAVKTMAELQIGDRVMVAQNVFSEVFMFTHKLQSGEYNFIKIETSAGRTVSATAGHYIYINGRAMAAENASVGDFVELADGTRTAITSLTSIKDRGLYNPQTVHGDIMVNDIRASTYTTAVDPPMAHALLTPLRALFSHLSFYTAYFDSGADNLARLVGKGGAVC